MISLKLGGFLSKSKDVVSLSTVGFPSGPETTHPQPPGLWLN